MNILEHCVIEVVMTTTVIVIIFCCKFLGLDKYKVFKTPNKS